MPNRKSDYRPIDCGLYDYVEIAIMRRHPVVLVYHAGEDETVTVTTRLLDTRTDNGEEFILLAEGDRWLRLDKIVSLDGRAFGGSCGI